MADMGPNISENTQISVILVLRVRVVSEILHIRIFIHNKQISLRRLPTYCGSHVHYTSNVYRCGVLVAANFMPVVLLTIRVLQLNVSLRYRLDDSRASMSRPLVPLRECDAS